AITDLLMGVITEIEDLDAVAGCHGATLRNGFDTEDPGTQVATDPGTHLTDGAQAVDSQGVALTDIGVLHGLPCGGQDIAEEEVPVVGEFIADLDRTEIRVGDTQVFRLTT